MGDYGWRLWFRIMRRCSILLAFKSALVIVLSYYAGFWLSTSYHFSMPSIAGLWCAISGIIVLQVYIKESLSAAWLRILGSFGGALMSFVFNSLLGYSTFSLGLCVFFTVMILSLCKIKSTFRLASLTAAIITIVGIVEPNLSPLTNSFSRFIESVIGALIAIAITVIFFPLRKKLGLLKH